MRHASALRLGAIEARVARLVNLAHAPCAERREDFVGPEAATRAEGHALGLGTGILSRVRVLPAAADIIRHRAHRVRSGAVRPPNADATRPCCQRVKRCDEMPLGLTASCDLAVLGRIRLRERTSTLGLQRRRSNRMTPWGRTP